MQCTELVREAVLRSLFLFKYSYQSDRDFRAGIKAAAATQGYIKLEAKDTNLWIEYFKAEQLVAFHPERGYIQTERLAAIKKAAPELNFIKREDEENDAADLPF
jgi:O-methyltransferase involved in polyketide biosynthesis